MTSQRLGLYIIFILMCLRDFNLNTLQQNCDVKALQFGYFLLSYKKKNLISWLRQLHLFKIFKCKWSFLTASLISAVSFNHYRKFSHCQKWPAHIHLCQMQWNNLNRPTALSLSLFQFIPTVIRVLLFLGLIMIRTKWAVAAREKISVDWKVSFKCHHTSLKG